MKKKISLILTFFLTISLLTACRKEIESIPYEEESVISSGEIIDFFNPDGTLYSDTTLISELELPVETEYTSENTWLFINPRAKNIIHKKDFSGIVYWSENKNAEYCARKESRLL
jgi:hypothetical protein